MKKLRLWIVSLLVALAVIVPLVVATVPRSTTDAPVVRIATEPTATPTPNNGQCHGIGC